jgi:D-3-phosphoglycerate dehydrogenase / 2-oxoglutarate reductase
MHCDILFIDSNHPLLHQTLERAGFTCRLNYNWNEEEIEKNIHLYDGIVIRSRIKITKKLIDKATRLKFIARAGAGMENIDVAYAESKGIKCIHAPEGNKDAVAEHALGMLLGLFNNLCRANIQVRSGKWIREGNRGIELMGRTVGIIGYGNMGSNFAQRLQGFGVKVIAYDKYKTAFSNTIATEVSLEQLLEETDILSLHIPLTSETEYLVNNDFINRFKKNIYLINTARGKVLKIKDLISALKTGKIKGACLDVLEFEDTSFEGIQTAINNPQSDSYGLFQELIQFENVQLSPHVAGWTMESNEKIARVLAEKIIDYYITT